MPLVHQVDRRRHDERTDARVGDRLEPEERLPAAGREHDAALSAVVDPGVERGLLVVPRFDVDRRRQIKIGIGPSGVLD